MAIKEVVLGGAKELRLTGGNLTANAGSSGSNTIFLGKYKKIKINSVFASSLSGVSGTLYREDNTTTPVTLTAGAEIDCTGYERLYISILAGRGIGESCGYDITLS